MTSKQEHERGREDSVFDFIYVDQQRISLLISQLSDFGEVTSISEEKDAGHASEKYDEFSTSANAVLASGRGTIGNKVYAHSDRSIQRTYDSRWLNALNFLDEAEHRSLINRELRNARIGEVVLAKGPLRIRDFSSLSEIWHKPSMKKSMEVGLDAELPSNRSERRKPGRKNSASSKSKMPTDLEIFLDLVDVLPHTTQAIVGRENLAWGLLKDEGLIGSPSDFALKFGSSIPGEWAMIGVLEAFPGESKSPDDILQTTQLDQVCDALFMHLEPVTRQLLGRPAQAYGLTPLMIMRQVT